MTRGVSRASAHVQPDAVDRCAICRSDGGERGLFVDHGHADGHVRGFLCSRCNSALGLFSEDDYILERAIAYLRADRYVND
jgi:hypothetical protein